MAKQGLVQTVPPAAEPIAPDEIRQHVRQDLTVDDAQLAGGVAAARRYAEAWTGRQLVTATWRLSLDSFYAQALEPRPGVNVANLAGALAASADAWRVWQERGGGWGAGDVGVLRLPRPPQAAVLSVQYVDPTGTLQTAPASLYQVDADREPARLAPAYGQVWPATRAQMAAVQVTYQAGYGGPAAVPDDLKAAIRLLACHYYEHREPVPLVWETIHGLLGPHWDGEYG